MKTFEDWIQQIYGEVKTLINNSTTEKELKENISKFSWELSILKQLNLLKPESYKYVGLLYLKDLYRCKLLKLKNEQSNNI